MNEIFLPLVGQHENIGDIILRRPLPTWLRRHGQLHAYVGYGATAAYVRGLGLDDRDLIYHSLTSWLRAWAAAALRGRAHYFFKPGEIQLTLVGMKEHIGMLPWIVLTRLRRGHVVRIGAGARNYASLPRALMRPSLSLPELTLWRDADTRNYLKVGEIMPDLGFNEGSTAEQLALEGSRPLMVVSMRGDRPYPPAAWINGVRDSAKALGLQPMVVTQVARDSNRSQQLAAELGAGLLDWDGEKHDVQEEALREVYRRSALAVSDRLHVLIGAFTEGTIPLALVTDGSPKIRRHLEVVGMGELAHDSRNLTPHDVVVKARSALDQRSQWMVALATARERLDAVRQQVDGLFGAA